MIETKDSKGRVVVHDDDDGYYFERVFDDSWDTEIPAEVIEYINGIRVYERHYNTVTKDWYKPCPYDAGIRPQCSKPPHGLV